MLAQLLGSQDSKNAQQTSPGSTLLGARGGDGISKTPDICNMCDVEITHL